MMKKLLFILCLAITLSNSQTKPPYETTWIELTEKGNEYIIRNYPDPNFYDPSFRSVNKIIAKKDSIVNDFYWEAAFGYKIDNVKNKAYEIYIFTAGEYENMNKHDKYKFQWHDKGKHIARWIYFYDDGRISRDELYIDSLYNTYPIVDCIWKDEGCVIE